jgi:protein TonB
LIVSEREDHVEESWETKKKASPKPLLKAKIIKNHAATDVPSRSFEQNITPPASSAPIDTHVPTAVEPAPQTNWLTVEIPATAPATRVVGAEETALSDLGAGTNVSTGDAESSGGGNEGRAPPVRRAYLPPDYAHNPIPEYPERARRQGWQGTVLLDVLINQEGSPQKIEIRQSSGFEILDRAAFKAVMAWRFAPARYGETALDGWVRVPLVFRLNEEKIDR